MATIEPVTPLVIDAIYAAREAENKNFDSIGLSMSELGSECDRALWLSFRWASEPEQFTGRKLSIFDTGHSWEARLIADLRRIPGVEVTDIDPETGKQWKVYAIGGHLRGKLDAEVIGLPEAPVTIHVVEIKSHNEKSFNEVKKKGVKLAKPAHWWQCQMYMERRGRTRCLYLIVNKNTDERWSERVDFDPVAIMQMMVRVERIISSNELPSRIKESATAYPCMLCKHKVVCHSGDFGRRNCRTCINATPIIDPHSTDATWLCEKFGKTLTPDEQKAGCHAHLLMPHLVPGEQVDSGEDWISYKMPDGSTWTDQEKKPPPEPEISEDKTIRYWHDIEERSLYITVGIVNNSDNNGMEELTAEQYEQAQAYYAILNGEAQ
jgi:hypothetical protein